MIFSLKITGEALEELRDIYEYIAVDKPKAAKAHIEKVQKSFLSLKRMPLRCPIAREKKLGDFEIRQLIYENYRILFTVKGKTVLIIGIRHSARLSLSGKDS